MAVGKFIIAIGDFCVFILYYSDLHVKKQNFCKIMNMNRLFGRVLTVLWLEIVHGVKFDFTTTSQFISLCSYM